MEKGTGNPLGLGGMYISKRNGYEGLYEIGWMFLESAQGKGYASEISAGLIERAAELHVPEALGRRDDKWPHCHAL